MNRSVTSLLQKCRSISLLWVSSLILTACLPAFGQTGNTDDSRGNGDEIPLAR